jgi:hypothetical protein
MQFFEMKKNGKEGSGLEEDWPNRANFAGFTENQT